MSRRIAPSERLDQELQAFLDDGIRDSEQPLSMFMKLAIQKVVHQANGAIRVGDNRRFAGYPD